jgi:autotransporter-associated beta strand protein
MSKFFLNLSIVLFSSGAFLIQAQAQTTWTGNTDNDWQTNTNWSPSTAPSGNRTNSPLTFSGTLNPDIINVPSGMTFGNMTFNRNNQNYSLDAEGSGSQSFAANRFISVGTATNTTNATLSFDTMNLLGATTLSVARNTSNLELISDSSGAGNFIKTGNGTVTLRGDFAHTGGTTLSAGTMIIESGGLSGAGAVSVNGTLAGGGSIGGLTTLNSAGILSPGGGLGGAVATLAFGNNLTLHSSGNVVFNINGTGPGTTFDQITVAGSISYTGVLTINFGFTPSPTETFQIFNVTGSKTGTFTSISVIGGGVNPGDVSFNSSTGTLTIPEPSTWALMSFGVAFVLWRIRRRKAAQR